jgi:glycosyltransferase involved in cell wall biosynthesis
MRKYAVATVAYNESEYIGACIRNWQGLVDKHLVLVSEKPWNGQSVKDDGTADIARSLGAEVIVNHWDTEAHQRNEGLAILYDYDYVLIVDADELYTKDVQKTLIKMMDHPIDKNWRTDRQVEAFRIESMTTYWKNSDYVLEPQDGHKPIIAVDPKQLFCHEHRQFGTSYAPLVPGTCHHFSWAKSDNKIKEKIQSFSHADIMVPNWYENVWKPWAPGSDMQVRPYGNEESFTRYKPAPQEILDLLKG